MSLSLQKILLLLDKCNMYASKYYTKGNDRCSYINIISKTNGNEYMLYIPSKYNVSIIEVKKNVFHIKTFNKGSKYDFMNDYGNYNQDVTKEMGNSMLSENQLLNNYKVTTNENYKSLNRHMNRIKYIIKSSDYNVIIENGSLLSVINKNDIVNYTVKNVPQNNNHKLLLSFDIEFLIKKLKKLDPELLLTKNKIITMLDTNYSKNINYIHNLITTTNFDAETLNNHIMSKKRDYHNLITELNDLLKLTNEKERKYKIDIENGNTGTIQHLTELLKTKSEILIQYIEVINNRDNITILCDKILFDNIILLNQLKTNIETFYKL